MKVIVGFCLLAVAFARQERCGQHQTYNECGTSCPLTCDNFNNPPRVCGLVCVPGCHCDEGYVRTRDKRCVRKEECPMKANSEREANEFCLAVRDPGVCRSYLRKWYYNARTGTCKMFVYGGCQGNRNRYDSEQECLNRCKGLKLKKSKSNVCGLSAESGACSSYSQRFYFDPYSGQCKMFIYSGCGGNGNNFSSLQECLGRCGK